MENFNDSKALAIEIAKILDKKKAHDVRVLKVESLTVLTDYFVIASGTSTTQVASLADEVEFELSQKGLEPYSTEGYDSKNWVLLDYSNVIDTPFCLFWQFYSNISGVPLNGHNEISPCGISWA